MRKDRLPASVSCGQFTYAKSRKALFPSLIVQEKTPITTLVKTQEITRHMSGQGVASSSLVAREGGKNHTSDRYLARALTGWLLFLLILGKTLCFLSRCEKADSVEQQQALAVFGSAMTQV